MKHALSLLFLFVLPVVGCADSMPTALPKNGVAYTLHGALVIKDEAGKTVRIIRTTKPIGSFAISPDRQSVVFAPPGSKCNGPGLGRQGGPLYLFTLASGQTRRLTSAHKHVYDKREVYADPDFSPNGKQIVFAVHYQPCGDAVMTAGPYAMLDIQTLAIESIASTADPGGNGIGPAYGASPRWSPNGRVISVNLEGDLGLVSLPDKRLLDVSMSTDWIKSSMDVAGVDWWGNECLILAVANHKTRSETSAWVLNLNTHHTDLLNKPLGVTQEQVRNLVAFSPALWIQKIGSKLVVNTHHGTWSIADANQTAYVRVISSRTDAQVPLTCRFKPSSIARAEAPATPAPAVPRWSAARL